MVEADAARLPFGDGSFDLVVAFMSLQDIDDLSAAVAEASRMLEPGGRLVAAITHPTSTAGSYLGDRNDDAFALVRPYFKPARHVYSTETASGETVQLHGEHRPLEAYSRALSSGVRHRGDPRAGAQRGVPRRTPRTRGTQPSSRCSSTFETISGGADA